MGDPNTHELEDGKECGPDSSNGVLSRVVQIALMIYLIPAILTVCLVGVIAILITKSVQLISFLGSRLKLKFHSTEVSSGPKAR